MNKLTRQTKAVFSVLTIVLSILSIFGLMMFLRPVSVVQANYNNCVSTGPQCGTDNGTKIDYEDPNKVCPDGYSPNQSNQEDKKCKKEFYEYKDRSYDWECPENDLAYTSQNSSKSCKKKVNIPNDGQGEVWRYADKVKEYNSCGNGWQVVPNDESKCRKSATDYESRIYVCPQGYTSSGSGHNMTCSRTVSCQTGVKRYDSCTPAGYCPTQCGQTASQVPNGQGGYKQCAATPACPVDMCPNIAEVQTEVPYGMIIDENGQCVDKPKEPEDVCPNLPEFQGEIPYGYELVEGQCVEIPPTDPCNPPQEVYARSSEAIVLPEECNEEPPIGGPEATPSPAPDDGKSGHRSSLGNDNLQCTNTHFDAVMDVKWDGVGQKDVKVVFYFNGERIETRSDENGRARTQYPIGSGVLIAEADGYPTQSQVIAAPACGPVMLDPDGSVLGATTLAGTGSQDLYMAAGIVGSGLSLIGSTVYGYIKKKQNA